MTINGDRKAAHQLPPDRDSDPTQQLRVALKERFGFDRFLDGQRQVMARIMARQSTAAIFPTGAGKSLCYQLPALLLPGMTLVVSPLLALMKDQLEFLLSKDIPAAKLDSGMSAADYQAALRSAKTGSIKVLMIAVERFKNERFRNQLRQMKIDLLVVDEAHCISEWGHNFRPDYLKIPGYQQQFDIQQVLLLTATATPRVLEDMCQKFAIPRENAFVSGFYRDNLHLAVVPVDQDEKQQALVDALSAPPSGPTLVYVTLQKTAEQVAEALVAAGFDAEPYHAGMKMAQREQVQNRFMAGSSGIVVATIAFGMGIDKRDIRKVIHYDLPKSIENYSQEIGRAGRDGAPSVCTVLGNRGNLPVLENFVYGDTPEKTGIGCVLDRIRQAPGGKLEVRFQELSRASDIRLLPLKTLMVYLELKKIVIPKYAYFSRYPYKLLKTREEITQMFSGDRRDFVKTIFEFSRTAKVWTTPDIDAIVERTNSSRQRVLAALDYFDENGWIELVPKSAVEVFEVLRTDFDPAETIDALFRLFKEMEVHDIQRIQQMIDLFESPTCLAAGLSEYFGQNIGSPCGRCSVCREGKPAHLPPVSLSPLSNAAFTPVFDQFAEVVETPHSNDLVTRFLCGIKTPRLIERKATSLTAFGQLEAYPYREVSEWVARNLQLQV
jgi:ATP-dependent DNA helicase RecQ